MESFDALHEDRQHNGWLLLVGAFVFGSVFVGMLVVPPLKEELIAKNVPLVARSIFYVGTMFFTGLFSAYCVARFVLRI